MDTYAFIAEMTKALAWPLGAVIVVVIFRTQLGGLPDRMKHLKAPGIELDFTDKLDKVAGSLPVETGDASNVLPASQEKPSDIASMMQSGVPPAYIINSAWNLLERRLRKLYGIHASEDERRKPPRDILKIAAELQIPLESIESIKTLQSIRDEAAHTSNSLKPNDALRYVDLVSKVIAAVLTGPEQPKVGEAVPPR
jgi:hypothetical protein